MRGRQAAPSVEQETVTKGYDPVIMRRILGFARPYKLAAIFALLALAFSTAGELLLPVMLQRAIDEHLLAGYKRFDLDRAAEAHAGGTPGDEALNAGELSPDAIEQLLDDNRIEFRRLGDALYVLESEAQRLSGREQSLLRRHEILADESFYVFPLTAETREAAGARLIAENGESGVVPLAILDELPEERLRSLRSHDIEGVIGVSTIVLGLLLTVLLFSFAQTYLTAYVGQGVMRDLRLRLFDHTVHQALRFLDHNPVGKIVTRLTNDVETINELFTQVLVNLLKDVAIMIGVVITLYALNPRLATVTILTLPPVIVLTLVFRLKAREAFRRLRRAVSDVNAFLSEHISGMAVVQMFVKERRTGKAFNRRNEELLEANLGEMYVFATFRPLIDLLSTTSIAAVLYFGARFYLDGLVTLGVLIAFLNLVRMFYRPVMDIAEKFNLLQSAMAGGERVFEVLDQDQRVPDTGTTRLARPIRGEITFEHVSFQYVPGEPVLRDLCFHVDPGETVAVVGFTGAGKTTIANLLTRLWDVDEGRILIDGVDIRELPLSELRAAIQPIQQDVFLFDDTVAENIRLGLPIEDYGVMHAARTAQADSFISALPHGYYTPLNEGATVISTGQRQLVAFARVLAHDPPVLIMDEATANIDTETEVLIQEALQTVLASRTALVIAHRLSTIKHADRILVLANGELAEQGTHWELLQNDGLYATLYKFQYEELEGR